VAVWWWVPREKPPEPPDVTISDPAVAGAVAKARAEVVAHPKDAARWGRLGQTFLANGLLGPARECLAEAGKLAPQDPQWPYLEGVSLLLSDPVAAVPCWQRAAECPGDDDRAATARFRWAEVLLANDRFAEAESVLRALLVRRPNDPRVHLDLGLVAVARNDPRESLEHFRRCADHPSARRKVATQLAALYNSQGKTAEAAEFASRLSDATPDQDWPDPFLESYLSLTVGRDALFIQAEKLQQGNPQQAITLFQTVIRRYPDEARAYSKLGMLLAELGNYPAAEEILRAGLAVNPDMVQGHFFLAAALFPQAERLGLDTPAGREKLRQTATAARRATELKPDHGFAHLYLGLALNRLGQKAEAITALREAVRCTPEATDPHLHLGQALFDDGQTEQAVAELETAVRLASKNDPRPRAALERVKAGPKK
jgi:tetratricopeptide (TPR) repeat protein